MTPIQFALSQGKRTEIKERGARYAAFISTFRFPSQKDGENFRDLLKYYRISHNVTQRDMIACGAVNPDGSMTHGNSWDMAKELMRIEDERNASRKKKTPPDPADVAKWGEQFEAKAHRATITYRSVAVQTIDTKHGKFTAEQVEDLYGFYCALREYRHAYGKLKMSIPE